MHLFGTLFLAALPCPWSWGWSQSAAAGDKAARVKFTEVVDNAAAMSPKFEEKISKALPAFCHGSDNFLHCKKTVRKAFVCTELASRARDWITDAGLAEHVD